MCLFRHQVILLFAAMWVLFSLSGCAKAPDEELAAAKAAVKAAQDAGADKFMANNFRNVQKALEAAEAELALQNSAFILSRNYTRTKQFLKNATDLANEIKNEAPAAKEAMTNQVRENLELAKGMIKEAAADIKRASRSKEKKVIAKMKEDLSAAESALTRADAEFQAGNVLGASENLGNVQRIVKKITDNLSSSSESLM
jgi:hypothetical protein